MGQQGKALEFYMIAAHLTPKDILLWKRLARMSKEQGKYRQAIYCYTKGSFFFRKQLQTGLIRFV